jgi:hypothetical protein
MNCEFCNTEFKTKTSLIHHQKTAKYCIILQGTETNSNFTCLKCNKKLSTQNRLYTHEQTCKKHIEDIIRKECEQKLIEKDRVIEDQKLIIKEKDRVIEEHKLIIKEFQEEYKNKLEKQNKDLTEIIQYMAIERKCETIDNSKELPDASYELFPQPRNEENVIYILTTANMKKERRYILGKATNLTSTLSVYNKTDEHEVVYYEKCPDQEKMSIVETLVFSRLNPYREQANQEIFLLPKDNTIHLFSDTIKFCIKLVHAFRYN